MNAPRGNPAFPSTHWSVVRAAHGDDSAARHALGALCEAYWYPLYAFARRSGLDAERAQDSVQGYLARLMQQDRLARADPERGRFRAFLCAGFRNYLINQHAHDKALRRGGGRTILSIDYSTSEERFRAEPCHDETPERAFLRSWALTVLDRVMRELRVAYATRGKEDLFDCIKGYLVPRSGGAPYADTARELAMSEGALKVAVHRLRKRYRELLVSEISHSVDGPDEVEDEIRELLAALA